jgi:hypothetical protein
VLTNDKTVSSCWNFHTLQANYGGVADPKLGVDANATSGSNVIKKDALQEDDSPPTPDAAETSGEGAAAGNVTASSNATAKATAEVCLNLFLGDSIYRWSVLWDEWSGLR